MKNTLDLAVRSYKSQMVGPYVCVKLQHVSYHVHIIFISGLSYWDGMGGYGGRITVDAAETTPYFNNRGNSTFQQS